VVLPLLTEEIAENLLRNGRFQSAKQQVMTDVQDAVAREVPEVKARDVQKIIAPRELIPHNGYGKICPT